MFNKFLEFVKNDSKISSKKEFFEVLNGKSFLNGMYRLFSFQELEKWSRIVEETFPKYKGLIEVFGYDWLGRVFAINNISNTVIMLEPGTGDVLSIPVSFEDFHNEEIVEYHEDCLASSFFEKWYSKNNCYKLNRNECASYIIPLFLSGKDTVDNLEVSDMEVYWEIMMPLINM